MDLVFGHFRTFLENQLKQGKRIQSYCPFCYMASPAKPIIFKKCSYGCGDKLPISEYYKELTEDV